MSPKDLIGKRTGWTTTFLSLLAIVKAVGIAFNPWIALGVYAAGVVATKVIDENKKKKNDKTD